MASQHGELSRRLMAPGSSSRRVPLTVRKSWGIKPPLALFGPVVVVIVPSEAFGEVRMRLDIYMKGRACSSRPWWEDDDKAGSGWDVP